MDSEWPGNGAEPWDGVEWCRMVQNFNLGSLNGDLFVESSVNGFI